jgi:hypothetical protein
MPSPKGHLISISDALHRKHIILVIVTTPLMLITPLSSVQSQSQHKMPDISLASHSFSCRLGPTLKSKSTTMSLRESNTKKGLSSVPLQPSPSHSHLSFRLLNFVSHRSGKLTSTAANAVKPEGAKSYTDQGKDLLDTSVRLLPIQLLLPSSLPSFNLPSFNLPSSPLPSILSLSIPGYQLLGKS